MTNMKLFLLAVLGCSLHLPAVAGGHKVGFVDISAFQKANPMSAILDALDYPSKDLTRAWEKGAYDFRNVEIVVLASNSAKNDEIRRFLEKSRDELRSFIKGGGCLIVFSQRVLDRPSETWLPDGCTLLRTRVVPGAVGHVNRGHPIFSRPNAISHRRIAQDWTSEPVYVVSFRDVNGGSILAAGDESGGNPWCVEFGHGKGRAIFFACAPEIKAASSVDRNEDSTKGVTLDLMENTLAYAVDVVEGRGAPMPLNRETAGGKKTPPSAEKAFESEVDRAVDAGVAYLRSRQRPDGSWTRQGSHHLGPTALAVLALIGAGVNPYDPCILKGIDFLMETASFSEGRAYTYDVALIMMALDAKASPVNERFELERMSATERRRHAFKRHLTEGERAFMEAARDWLIDCRTPDGWWSYGAHRTEGDGDLSNTQFAVMGLNAAARCGVTASRSVWVQLLNHLMEGQADSGPRVTLPAFRSYKNDSTQPLFYERYVNARPWGYRINSNGWGATGSRACMGVASLLIGFEGLALSTKNESIKPSGPLRKAIYDGLGWLNHHWSVERNPFPESRRGGGSDHYYYYMYGIERIGVKLDSPFIGKHDWYREGAAQLLERQGEDGSWNGDVDTCFALMFLKRSTPPPVITMGR